MAEPQLSVRSAKARDLARREHRSIADVVERALEAYEARVANDCGSDLDLEAVIRESRKVHPARSFDLPRHQRHLGDAAQDAKPGCDRPARAQRCRAGIAGGDDCRDRLWHRNIRPDPRAARLEQGLASWRHRFADRIFPFTEAAALAYGDIMSAALRQGRPMTAPDGMIAAIARLNGGRLATRNLPDFETTGLELICPWDFRGSS